VEPEPPPPPPPAEAPPPPPKVDNGNAGTLNIAPDIRKICGITSSEALFDFDSSSVKAGDHPVLDKLAQCFISGPLAGRKMRLVGHADPRGDEEYNIALGGRRSDSVKGYLVRAGLKDEQGQSTSRGEMDAQGTDESSWVRDRRVDIVMAD
jgi:peptidoglycan-associated lipoprotein